MNDFKVTSAKQAIAELKKRGYDNDSMNRYAKAARSWSPRDSAEWKIWREVEEQTTSSAV